MRRLLKDALFCIIHSLVWCCGKLTTDAERAEIKRAWQEESENTFRKAAKTPATPPFSLTLTLDDKNIFEVLTDK